MENTITTNDRFDKLTNLDISTHYRDREYWFMRSDFIGAFAYWVVAQSPYDAPDITEALKAFSEYVSTAIGENIPKQFTYDELSDFLSDKALEAIPEIEKLNHPKIDNNQNITTNPDCDFICLGALSRNVFYMILRESITYG